MQSSWLACYLCFGLLVLGGCRHSSTTSHQAEEVAKLRAEISELREQLQRYDRFSDQLAWQDWHIKQLRLQSDWHTARILEQQARLGAIWDPAKDEQASALPERFTDQIKRYSRYSKPARPTAEFEMVLVPGDADEGIEPFYMSATEVTWAMFYDWAYSIDIDVDNSAKLQQLGLRPSPAYEDSPQFIGKTDRKPAMAMSYLTATSFCAWLSAQTGRTYRLPTHDEWRHALELGGGMPENREQLLQMARLRENFEIFKEANDPFDPFFDPEEIDRSNLDDFGMYAVSSEVGSLAPNTLGIYDMLGNATEWVSPSDGGKPRVVGGHYGLPAKDLSASWRLFENQDIWNATYPQRPVSRFWYKDFYYTGIRLVCEPVNIPAPAND